jgi:hypothetical protein
VGSCAACHQKLDPIGFGLERYDRAGRYRTYDDGAPECPISGSGRIAEMGAFSGPAELEALLVGSGQLERCAVTQLHRFAMGRRESAADTDWLDRLTAGFVGGGRAFATLLLDLVSDDNFRFRREE